MWGSAGVGAKLGLDGGETEIGGGHCLPGLRTGQYTTIQNFAFVLCDIGTVAFFCVASVESIDILSSVERCGEFLSPYSVFSVSLFRVSVFSHFGLGICDLPFV